MTEPTLKQAEQAWDIARDAHAERRGISKSVAALELSCTDTGRKLYKVIQSAREREILKGSKVTRDVKHVAVSLLEKKAEAHAADHGVPIHEAWCAVLKTTAGSDLYSVSKGYEPTTKVAPPAPPATSDAEAAQTELSRLAQEEANRSGDSYSRAMNTVLQSAKGKALYSRIYAGTNKSDSEIAKSAEDHLVAIAQADAEASGEPVHKAMDRLLGTDLGRDLYAVSRGRN